MISFEIFSLVLLLVMVALVGGAVLQVRTTARETRVDVRNTRASLSASVQGLREAQQADVQALRELVEDLPRTPVALPVAAQVAPKEHRCRYIYRTNERTNKQIREISTCEEMGCRNAQIKVISEDPSSDRDEFEAIPV